MSSSARRSRRTSRHVDSFEPDLAIGTTPVVQNAKQKSIPALYFTNLISARPLMGPAGAGSLAAVINAAAGNKARFDTMIAFFDGVGKDHTAGVWHDPHRLPAKPKVQKPLVAAKSSVDDGGLLTCWSSITIVPAATGVRSTSSPR